MKNPTAKEHKSKPVGSIQSEIHVLIWGNRHERRVRGDKRTLKQIAADHAKDRDPR